MSNQTQKFVKGTLILSIAGLLAKVLSAFFRVPLTALIGDEGIGYYGLAYPIYTLFSAIAVMGIPSTIAKMVAEKRVCGEQMEAHKIFTHTLKLMLIIGTVMSGVVFFGAPFIIKALDWEPGSIYSLWGLALSPIFVCIMGVYRGYFQGMQDMMPTAISQVAENAGRVLGGLALAVYFMPDVAKAAGGASFGGVIGGVFGSIVLLAMYMKKRNSILVSTEKIKAANKEINFKVISRRVLWTAIPISLGSAINSIMPLIDSGLVVMRLRDYGFDGITATELAGQLTKVATLINFPLTFALALIIGLVPSISEAMARGDKKELFDKIELGTRIALLISLPASIGLAVLSKPIMNLIYPKYPAGGEILMVASSSVIFVMLGQALAGILQGMGNIWAPIYAIMGAALVKFIGNYILITSPLGVTGAALASVLGYATYAIVNYIAVVRTTKFRINVKFVILKPLIASIVMGGVAYGTSRILSNTLNMSSRINNAIMTLSSVLVGVIVYAVILMLNGGISKEDIAHIKNRKNNSIKE